MRNCFLFFVCLIPFMCSCVHFIKINKSIVLLQEIQQLFMQMKLILNSTLLDVTSLLQVLECRNICPLLCKSVNVLLENGESFSESWNHAFSDKKYSVLSFSEKSTLISFADQFGMGTIEDQHTLCEQFISFCSQCICEKKESLLKNGKLTMSGSILFGCFLYVIFM